VFEAKLKPGREKIDARHEKQGNGKMFTSVKEGSSTGVNSSNDAMPPSSREA
jgi:hypothetical protein